MNNNRKNHNTAEVLKMIENFGYGRECRLILNRDDGINIQLAKSVVVDEEVPVEPFIGLTWSDETGGANGGFRGT